MIWTGPLPPHLQRAEQPAEEPWFDARPETPRAPQLPMVAAAGVALVAGIVIGVFAPQLLRSGAPRSAKPVVASIPARRAPQPEGAAPLPAAPAPTTYVPQVQPTAAAPRVALALLTPTAKPGRTTHEAKDGPPTPCARGSSADQAVCADPAIASADRDLQQAYQRALAAGAPPAALRADQIDWLLAREDAARRSPAELALAYRQRIDQLNKLADEPPH